MHTSRLTAGCRTLSDENALSSVFREIKRSCCTISVQLLCILKEMVSYKIQDR